MKFEPVLVGVLLRTLSSFAHSETVIEILHSQSNPPFREGNTTPDKAAKAIETFWQQNKPL